MVDCLTGSLTACLVTRRPTCTNPGQSEVSEDGENIAYSASSQAACAVGFESTNHPKPSGLATSQLERDSVPLDPGCEEKKCLDVATSDSSMSAPDCLDLTSGDQREVMCATRAAPASSTLEQGRALCEAGARGTFDDIWQDGSEDAAPFWHDGRRTVEDKIVPWRRQAKRMPPMSLGLGEEEGNLPKLKPTSLPPPFLFF